MSAYFYCMHLLRKARGNWPRDFIWACEKYPFSVIKPTLIKKGIGSTHCLHSYLPGKEMVRDKCPNTMRQVHLAHISMDHLVGA